MDQLLHVGYVKTATSFLQTSVFNNPDLGFGLAAGTENRPLLIQNTVLAPHFEPLPEEAAAQFRAHEAPLRDAGLMPVWSEETLLGDPVRRRYEGQHLFPHFKSLFPNAGVLITIRAQVPMAMSIYSQHIYEDGICQFDEFLGTGNSRTGFSPYLRADFLMYDAAIRAYHDAFGKDRVLVLPQELLRADPDQFYKKLSNFTGRSVSAPQKTGRKNERRSPAIMRLKRLTNHFLPLKPTKPRDSFRHKANGMLMRHGSRLIPASVSKKLDIQMQKETEQAFGDRFDASNRRTMELTGLPLDEFGYRVAPAT
jgi:hypothetical protein